MMDAGIHPFPQWLSRLTEDERKSYFAKVSAGVRRYYETHEGTFTGRHHTQETKEKLSEIHSIISKGEGNSQYGTCWIYNPQLRENKKILKDSPLEDGWYHGRIIDWSFLDRCCSMCGCHLHLKYPSEAMICERLFKIHI